MGRTTIPSCKQCRREGQKLFLKGDRCHTAKCAITRRAFVPGQHGATQRTRLTGYGIQLREKQKAKRQYGLMERQFRLYFERAKKKDGKTGDEMLLGLERRLDNVLYRAGFGRSRSEARQMVSHGQVTLNGRAVDIPSIEVNSGDVIEVKETKRESTLWQDVSKRQQGDMTPQWLTVDQSKLSISVSQEPTMEMINSEIQMHLIVELYSL